MIFEYKHETIELTPEQVQALELNLVSPESVNDTVVDLINKEAQDTWEPLYPFSFPCVWFRREKLE